LSYGAAPEDWIHFDLVLGLGEDLLPCVANPDAVISPRSKMKALGKTPSRYNMRREVGGIPNWTDHTTTPAEISRWAAEPDYSICLQTRVVRAIDVDVEDEQLSREIHDAIVQLRQVLPARRRDDSSKFLLAFRLPGEYPKRTIKTRGGIIEFLATGQQFIACGTHPSGARYTWGVGGLPSDIPELQPDEFEELWRHLAERFGAGDTPSGVGAGTVSKSTKISEATQNDPTAKRIVDKGLVISTERDGRLFIECPFAAEHTSDSSESATTYFPAFTGGFERGHFHCLHAHCEGRTDAEFLAALDLLDDPRDDFEAADPEESIDSPGQPPRFVFVGDTAFAAGEPMSWFIKGVLPKAELGVVYGPPSSGKSFFALDIAMAIARGEPWRGRKVNKARVGYVAAEGAGGFRNRIRAYRKHFELPPEDVLQVMSGTPNLLQKGDVVDLGNAITRAGGLDLIFYDTLARGTVGGDENSAQDMGVAIANCRTLHDVTGATVILIHHSGKDPSKGARGSNAVLGAVDVEIEITRVDDNRTATVSKLKDGKDGVQFGFRLLVVGLDIDEDGDEVSSCVIEPCEPARSKPKGKKMSTWEERVWAVARDLQGVEGPPSVAEVTAAATEGMPADEGAAGKALSALCLQRRLEVVAGRVTIPGGD